VVPNSSSTMAVLKTAPRIGAGATYLFQVTPGLKFSSSGICIIGVELGVELREKTLAVELSTCREFI